MANDELDLETLLKQSIALEKDKKYIAERQATLAQRTLELNNKIAEAKKRKELEQIQLIIIEKVEHGLVTIDTNGKPRSDVLTLLGATPSRRYDWSSFRNTIDIRYFPDFLDKVKTYPNVEVKYLEKNEEYLKNYFTEPMWNISKGEKSIIIKKAERNLDTFRVQKIPSATYNTQKKEFNAPFSEGWRVIQVFPIGEDVSYTNEVLELISKQVEQRRKMDEVALNKDADIPNPFINDFELKPFQKAGVFFMMNALGIEIPEKK